MRAKRTLSLIAAAVTVTALAAVGATLVTGTDKKPPPKTGFIQGKVTSGDRHPEAGVWVIAETADLPTPYRKIVVTDDRGPVRRSRAARGRLPGVGAWLRAPRLGEGARHGRAQGQVPRRHRGRGRRHAAGAGGQLPRQLLAVALQAPREHAGPAGRAQPARLDERLQARLRALPPDGLGQRARHARQPGRARRRPQEGRQHGRRRDGPRPRRPARRARRLGRPHRRRPGARGAAAPQGHRAQHGHHPVGLGRPLHLRPRRDRHRQAQPAALPGREDLGRRPRQRPPAERRPGHPRGRRAARAHGRRLRHAVGRPGAERLPVARRPRPGRLDPAPGRVPEPGEPAQPDDGRHRQGLDDHPDPGRAAPGLPRVLPRTTP